jgi:hypothetical protein
MNRKPSRRCSLALGVALVLLASLAGARADAQTLHLFPCKIVCGYELGNVRLLNDTSPLNQPYEDLKPGNYATTCNLFNYDIQAATQTVFPYVAVEGAGLIFLGPVTVPALTNLAYGCVDIITSLGNPPLNGIGFEGYLTFFTFDPDFHGDGVRTYSSQNAFERHVLWSYDPFGTIRLAFQVLNISLPLITAPLPDIEGFLEQEGLTASGAGGLGLGASIDVEEVRRIDIDLGVLTAEDRERLPVEVRDQVPAAAPAGDR